MHTADIAAATVRDTRLGNLRVLDGVGRGDVLRTHDPGNGQFTHLAIGANLLAALNDHIAVGQDLRHQSRDGQGDLFLPLDRAAARTGGRATIVEARFGIEARWQ